ncbi:hypothetical protein IU436_30790 [Nocardia farcinica]|uniref:5-methylcytosine restriction system specificity protein McrC n=1 Tax=Nocardia farcinica TaxID=37329 RepID=UPI0018934895|nr:hypothetical protein [Nocardia farcinica]MBF6271613.1 hypothetical protein [Nocardia farcinica]MBF6422984.1 hypothetical protein [Nocardia farcinica]MBF6434696.1 hypothetical protein [Nocardia farcinica]MBF6505803.1 hypothetical protein [Nocardia farcinica]
MRRRVVEAVEGAPIGDLNDADLVDLTRARARLKERLKPRLSLFEDTTAGCVPRNIVGTISLNSRTVLRVAPKVGDDQDWVGAALDLMLPERSSVAGHRQAARTGASNSLEDGLAAVYRERLDRALRAEGPIEVMHTEFAHSAALTGRLDVERWVLEKPFGQLTFPVHRSVLDANNELTAALALAAVILSRSVTDGTVRNALVKLSRDIRPGLPDSVTVDPSVIGRPLPQQWSAYNEAWSIAQVVLSNSRFASRHGTLSGVEVALEPWILLEELLDRTVREVVRRGQADGHGWHNKRHPSVELLRSDDNPGRDVSLARLLSNRTAYPENLIMGPDGPIASFEAKYSRPKEPVSIRNHMYQLLTTAAHAGSPRAVLVYPELSEPIHWSTVDSHTPVNDVFAVGLNLYGYSKHSGVAERAQQIFDLLLHSSSMS